MKGPVNEMKVLSDLLKLDLQMFAEGEEVTPETPKTEESNKEFSIDYDKIIDGVFAKLKENEVEKKDNQQTTNIPEDKVAKLNEDYFNRAMEFETKFTNKEKEYNDLLAKHTELQNTVAEQNKKLQEYSTFGKTSEEIVENSRKLQTVDKNLNGLRRI